MWPGPVCDTWAERGTNLHMWSENNPGTCKEGNLGQEMICRAVPADTNREQRRVSKKDQELHINLVSGTEGRKENAGALSWDRNCRFGTIRLGLVLQL